MLSLLLYNLAKVVEFVQPAVCKIKLIGTPLLAAAEVEAALKLCALNSDTSTPASSKDCFNQRETVAVRHCIA